MTRDLSWREQLEIERASRRIAKASVKVFRDTLKKERAAKLLLKKRRPA